MLVRCRHICLAWVGIGLLTLAVGIAAGVGDLVAVGAFAVVAFGALGVSMASDEFAGMTRWLEARATGHVRRPELPARSGFWSRPSPYVLLPLTGYVVLVGRSLLRPPRGEDARLLILVGTVAVLVLTVVYLSLLAAEGAGTAASPARSGPPPPGEPAGPPTAAEAVPEVGAIDTTQFTREVLGADPTAGVARP